MTSPGAAVVIGLVFCPLPSAFPLFLPVCSQIVTVFPLHQQMHANLSDFVAGGVQCSNSC